jgi:predicted metal-dependent phosphoesterase TrpH
LVSESDADETGIDLHIHSTASDGTLTPAEIIALACRRRLGAISITDHDSIAGARDAMTVGIPEGLGFLTGVEISAAPPPGFDFPGSLHILGYGFCTDAPALCRTLEALQASRRQRIPQILQRLDHLGLPISLEALAETAGNAAPGRPHIARAMVDQGYAVSIEDAFDRYLAHGRPAYAEKYRVAAQDAIAVIRAAGGAAVLAHPFLVGTSGARNLEDLIATLTAMGLQGIECYYPQHPAEATAHCLSLARRHTLLVTGGTDFHGAVTPDIQIGEGAGDFFVPYRCYAALLRCVGAKGCGNGR